jgi:hypothetical protein
VEIPEELVKEMAGAPVLVRLPKSVKTGKVIGPAQYPGEWIVELRTGDDSGNE